TARERLTKLEGLNLITPSAQASPLLSFDLPAFSPGELFALTLELSHPEAAAKPLVIRSTPHAPFCLRAAFGFFNNEEDVDLLVAAVARALERGPAALKVEGYAATLPPRAH
ncbi:MAG: hypothetical protein JRH20_26490, partial [Deltaproteobacteria bacterium]|nr:hypothetical protein [Deltaproteobacteria bacterium]